MYVNCICVSIHTEYKSLYSYCFYLTAYTKIHHDFPFCSELTQGLLDAKLLISNVSIVRAGVVGVL